MSLDRLFHWTCDLCGIVHFMGPYGLPPNWTWFQDEIGGPIKHKCENCRKKLGELK